WPTILDNVNTNMRIAWEEPFGPVLPFIRIISAEQAIEISNKSEYGLQGMIFTNDIDLAFNIAQELEVGTVQINGKSARGPDHFPFLGTKSSGLGTQGIKYSIEAMSRPKVVVINLSERGKLVKQCFASEK
ncbi:MAG: aldehyde dehydrogenase family protein, partial [Candidatus Hodarchaeota archaeon]